MFNRFYRIKLPEYLGFFCGQTFRSDHRVWPLFLPVWSCPLVWPPVGTAIQTFSQWAAYQNPVVALGIYGFIDALLVPFGLHHIEHSFQMQIGEYTNAAGQVFHGDIHVMAGDPTPGG